MTQKVHYYKTRLVPDMFSAPHYNEARYYFSERSFTLKPKEEIIIILRNTGQHLLKPQTFRFIELINDRISSANDATLYQPCLWIINTSTNVTLNIPNNSSLTVLLNNHVITFEYSLINFCSLYK